MLGVPIRSSHQICSRVSLAVSGTKKKINRLKRVAERPDVAGSAWNDGSNEWYSDEEEIAFQLGTTLGATSDRSLSRLFNGCSGSNRSVFITLKPRGDDFLSVCPIIPVVEGDFLGIFAGTIRFAEDVGVTHSVPGPVRDLSLDYSHVTWTLNQMQMLEPGCNENVRLVWEAVNEQDKSGPCESWRVLVLATRPIMPFEPLIRAALHIDQFHLHQNSDHAKRGFTVIWQ
jgi:hypothetical protein